MSENLINEIFKGLSMMSPAAQEDLTVIFILLFIIFLFFIFLCIAFCIVLLVVMIVGRWMLFTKAGQAGWKAIIPFYSEYVFVVDVCKCHWVLFLLELLFFWNIPLLLFVNAMIHYNLGIKTHQSPTAFIWFTIFGVPLDSIMGVCRKSYEYSPDEPSSKFGFIGTKQ